jgi:hypothetical protein
MSHWYGPKWYLLLYHAVVVPTWLRSHSGTSTSAQLSSPFVLVKLVISAGNLGSSKSPFSTRYSFLKATGRGKPAKMFKILLQVP